MFGAHLLCVTRRRKTETLFCLHYTPQTRILNFNNLKTVFGWAVAIWPISRRGGERFLGTYIWYLRVCLMSIILSFCYLFVQMNWRYMEMIDSARPISHHEQNALDFFIVLRARRRAERSPSLPARWRQSCIPRSLATKYCLCLV